MLEREFNDTIYFCLIKKPNRKKMSLSISPREKAIRARLEFARCLVGKSPLCEEALKKVFNKNISQIEDSLYIPLEKELKEKIWEAIAPNRIKDLKEKLYFIFNKYVLEKFESLEIEEMRCEYAQKGHIEHPFYCENLRLYYNYFRNDMIDEIVKKSNKLEESIRDDIQEELYKNGICIF